VETDGQTDHGHGGDCITSGADAVGNNNVVVDTLSSIHTPLSAIDDCSWELARFDSGRGSGGGGVDGGPT